jgi:hypothetical protein
MKEQDPNYWLSMAVQHLDVLKMKELADKLYELVPSELQANHSRADVITSSIDANQEKVVFASAIVEITRMNAYIETEGKWNTVKLEMKGIADEIEDRFQINIR